MSVVVLDVAMSLDGFTAGPNISEADPMGQCGERLHEWMWKSGNGPDADFNPVNSQVGAALVGRRTFDLGVGRWGEGSRFGGLTACLVLGSAGAAVAPARGAFAADRDPDGGPDADAEGEVEAGEDQGDHRPGCGTHRDREIDADVVHAVASFVESGVLRVFAQTGHRRVAASVTRSGTTRSAGMW